jgi:SAM-dependent methyltransferase
MSQSTDPSPGTSSLRQAHKIILDRVGGRKIRVYEAGGGSASYVPKMILNDCQITVVDIDKSQLERNKYAHTKILADVQTQTFPRDSFELIVCYNVIEHLEAPDQAINLFYQALAPGGLLFIGAPNPRSFSGWITRGTPHWFHVQYYRRVLKYELAGQSGHCPFRTIFHRIVAPSQLIKHCRHLGLNLLYYREYKGWAYVNLTERRPLLGKLLNFAMWLANCFVFWQRDLRNGDYHVVLEKPIH